MGNIQTSEDVYNYKREALKKIYKMDQNQLEELRKKLKSEREKSLNIRGLLHDNELQRLLVNELRVEQNKLYGKVPNSYFNNVNTFLSNVSRDISTFIPNRNPIPQAQPQQPQQQQQFPQQKPQSQQKTPQELLGLSQNYTLNDLKKTYRKLALKYHPDRNSIDTTEIFEKCTEAYMQCLEDLKLKESNKTHNELKINSGDYIQNQEDKPMMNENLVGRNFSREKFNALFQEYRTSKPEDSGYSEWLKSHENKSEEPEVNPNLQRNFNALSFNTEFESSVKPCKNEIIEYKNPKELVTTGGEDCQELGVSEIKNFSGGTKNIQYSDLREAHTKTRLVDPNMVDISNRAKSIDTLRNNRKKKIKDYTEEEWAEIQSSQLKEKELQESRQIHLKESDAQAFEKYDKIHKLMLTNVYK